VDEASKLNGELVQLSVSLADARQSLEEQETIVLSLQQAIEDARQALEAEKNKVEGELASVRFFTCRFAFWESAPNFLFLFVAFRPADRPREHNHPG
jgi:capsule polysaccharide export protein KpsE/RkpR